MANGWQGDKEDAGRRDRSCPGPQTTTAHGRPQPRAETKNSPVLNKQVYTKSPKKGGKRWDWWRLILLGLAWQATDARLLVMVLHQCAAMQGSSAREKKDRIVHRALFLYPVSVFLNGMFYFFHKGITKQRDIHRRFEVIESYLANTERKV